jgi:glycosyltransferase involved in cell wall biosynthesis
MRKPSVSVVIPNYNYGRFLPEAVESVLAQTYPCEEIIVVDDGSTDDSLEILKIYEERRGVKVIRQKNRGVGAARNAGARASTGDLIAFLDADDIWFPAKVEKQTSIFQGDEKIGLVSCAMQEFDTDGQIINYYQSNQEGWVSSSIVAFETELVVSGSAIMVRRFFFDEVNGFDERKELHPSEDWEFFYRISRVSKIGFSKEVLVHYRNHGDNGHLKVPRFERAMLLAYEKIFQNGDRDVLKLRRKSYGNLYKTLAGSYLHAGQYGEFLKNTVKSLFYTPENFPHFAAFPLRRLRKKDCERTLANGTKRKVRAD